MTRTALAALLACLVAAGLLGVAHPAAGQFPVTGIIEGPDALAPGATGTYFVNASGGPAGDAAGNFSIRFWITGADLTGGLPLPSSPLSQQGNASGAFKVNITAPQKEEGISLVVEVNSTAGARWEKATATKGITVIAPIVLAATFRNDGDAAAVNVPVTFFVDGKRVGSTNLSRIDPKASATATLTWLPVGLAQGTHTVRIEADLNRNGVIEQDKGEVAFVDVFYKKGWELTWPWAILISLSTIVVTSLIVRARRRRG